MQSLAEELIAHTRLAIPTEAGPIDATLYWREGRIEVEASMPGVFSLSTGFVEIKTDPIPETLLMAAVGRPLSFLFHAPFACDVVITAIKPILRGYVVGFESEDASPLLVGLDLCRTWQDAAGSRTDKPRR